MSKYKVFYESREVQYAIIEAHSAEEAEELADTNFSEYDWDFCDGTLTGDILIGETEEVND
jgi:hypothetical protein